MDEEEEEKEEEKHTNKRENALVIPRISARSFILRRRKVMYMQYQLIIISQGRNLKQYHLELLIQERQTDRKTEQVMTIQWNSS